MALFTPSIARLRALPVAALLLSLTSLSAQAQTPISITGGTAVYTQNFDGMGSTGTNGTYPAGWAGLRYAGNGTVNDPLTPVVLLSTSISGAVYSSGGTGETDRAIGSLASASTAPAYGAVFVNNSGATITRLTMAARAEQWRTGSNATVNETVVFEYSLDATNLNNGTTATWNPVTTMDLTEIATTSTTAGPLDGNAAANSKSISGVLTGLNWPVGGNLWIRWRDQDDNASDGLLAVDNFALATGNTTLATQNIALESALSVFPNPATNRLTLRMGKEGVGASVEIYNALGQRVQQATATKEDLTLDVSALRAGVYTIRFTTNGGTATRSFLKQ
ncbi:T9SS type A sorting domain-containing protein [Hymenobacter cellulosilyticus]|uniref:T9SS type A sorting domain-containing protein n=1 Tax=Hymenobacter cellulosilyticus TaxID=2932248 RepID=A0A8T9QG46_9BACT|nr:T9SS type A sorting domain-containing protein [Hymenobacter cellulosilyticus]UOQ74539.1 T9SS type A sorting domain-containing protein [Hymenobacter cellulosilyticus]